jgi:hypothetical protein
MPLSYKKSTGKYDNLCKNESPWMQKTNVMRIHGDPDPKHFLEGNETTWDERRMRIPRSRRGNLEGDRRVHKR